MEAPPNEKDKNASLSSVIDKAAVVFKQKENENNWQTIDKMYTAIIECVKKSNDKAMIISEIRRIKDNLEESVSKERSAVELVVTLCGILGNEIELFAEFLVSPLIKLCARPNRITLSRAENALVQLFSSCEPKKQMTKIFDCFTNSNKAVRIVAAKVFQVIVSKFSCLLEHQKEVESCFKKGLEDPAIEVRDVLKKAYFEYSSRFPALAEQLIAKCSPIVQKNVTLQSSTSLSKPSILKTRTAEVTADAVKKTSLLSKPQRMITKPSTTTADEKITLKDLKPIRPVPLMKETKALERPSIVKTGIAKSMLASKAISQPASPEKKKAIPASHSSLLSKPPVKPILKRYLSASSSKQIENEAKAIAVKKSQEKEEIKAAKAEMIPTKETPINSSMKNSPTNSSMKNSPIKNTTPIKNITPSRIPIKNSSMENSTPSKNATPVKNSPTKNATPIKNATPLKNGTPMKNMDNGTPVKNMDNATPVKNMDNATPVKSATPIKIRENGTLVTTPNASLLKSSPIRISTQTTAPTPIKTTPAKIVKTPIESPVTKARNESAENDSFLSGAFQKLHLKSPKMIPSPTKKTEMDYDDFYNFAASIFDSFLSSYQVPSDAKCKSVRFNDGSNYLVNVVDEEDDDSVIIFNEKYNNEMSNHEKSHGILIQ